jgi:hypothetical protein
MTYSLIHRRVVALDGAPLAKIQPHVLLRKPAPPADFNIDTFAARLVALLNEAEGLIAGGERAASMVWSDKERAALDELMALQELSERAVIKQALAHYQIICRRAHGRFVELTMPFGEQIEGAPTQPSQSAEGRASSETGSEQKHHEPINSQPLFGLPNPQTGSEQPRTENGELVERLEEWADDFDNEWITKPTDDGMLGRLHAIRKRKQDLLREAATALSHGREGVIEECARKADERAARYKRLSAGPYSEQTKDAMDLMAVEFTEHAAEVRALHPKEQE